MIDSGGWAQVGVRGLGVEVKGLGFSFERSASSRRSAGDRKGERAESTAPSVRASSAAPKHRP